MTTDDCPEGSRTGIDMDNLILDLGNPACCTVTGGTCKIKGTFLATNGMFLFANGKNTGFEMRGCGLAPAAPPRAGRRLRYPVEVVALGSVGEVQPVLPAYTALHRRLLDLLIEYKR
jgi:hypothetical protein